MKSDELQMLTHRFDKIPKNETDLRRAEIRAHTELPLKPSLNFTELVLAAEATSVSDSQRTSEKSFLLSR